MPFNMITRGNAMANKSSQSVGSKRTYSGSYVTGANEPPTTSRFTKEILFPDTGAEDACILPKASSIVSPQVTSDLDGYFTSSILDGSHWFSINTHSGNNFFFFFFFCF